LRMCEDRGIEPYMRLLGQTNGHNVYGRLFELFQQADDRYNSGLFHFRDEKGRNEAADTLTPALKVDDKPLRDIIKNLYYPDSPYEFAVLPADILGQVYEQFLGKVIRLTAGHHAVVEDKPEVKKAGGVFYTPTYIVDYIVENTVGKLLEGKTPKQAAKLRILDPACGSGSFLIGAYQKLMNWHRDWYVEHGIEKHTKEIYQGPGGEWRLTTAERKRILLNNIYGVDIDPQAVEVTKLSLLLKVLEGESDETLAKQLQLFHERALPDLSENIKCGNSLVGPDFFDDYQLRLLDDEERYRINVFDWNSEFVEILDAGGFDVVIGNPPYVRSESIKELKAYAQNNYQTYHSSADLYVYFIERGVSLLRHGGQLGFIVSSSFLRASYAAELRRFLLEETSVKSIVDFGGLAVFANAKDTYVCIPLFEKGGRSQTPLAVSKVDSLLNIQASSLGNRRYEVAITRFTEKAWPLQSDDEWKLFTKLLSTGVPLSDYVNDGIYYGIKTGLNEAFAIDNTTRDRIISACPLSESLVKHVVSGKDIRRYALLDQGHYLIVIPSGWTRTQMGITGSRSVVAEREAWDWLKTNYRSISEHLDQYVIAARKRSDMGDYWWELRPCDYYEALEKPKIIYPDIAKGPRFFLDEDALFITNTAYCLAIADKYLLGVLNSKLAWFAISCISIPFGIRAGRYRYRLIYQYLRQVPIRQIDPSSRNDISRKEMIASLAQRMMDLNSQIGASTTPIQRASVQREMNSVDRRINQLVYCLYGLTEAEIDLIEKSTGENT
jgi:hypothetical protein